MIWIIIYLVIGVIITIFDFLNLKYRYPNKWKSDIEKARANNVPVDIVFLITVIVSVILWQIVIINFVKEKSWRGEKHERKTGT